MMLSPHFALSEFTRSNTATVRGIDNTPGHEQVANLVYLCRTVLEPLREKFGPIVINSGFRCPELNKLVGGADNSQHMTGEACDIHVPSPGIGRRYFEFLASLPVFDQLIWERASPRSSVFWIHVSARRIGKNRRQNIPILHKHK